MDERARALLVAHGAALFLAGLAAGFPYAFEILGRIEVWPLPGSLPVELPGDERGWRMAHLEGILNGLALVAVGAAGGLLRLSERAARALFWALVATGWGNVVASWIAPLVGERGLAFGGSLGNRVVFLLFLAAVVAVALAMVLVLRGALAAARAPRAG